MTCAAEPIRMLFISGSVGKFVSFKAIDLFAGAGGFTLSAIEAGVEVLGAIEFDKSAAMTYKANFKAIAEKLINDDINKIKPKDFRESLGIEKRELDLILGGPPCQGFSSHRIKDAGVDDPRNELLLRYFSFVREFKPKAFLVENVSGLLWQRHEKHLNKFLSLADRNGYAVKFCDTLNAKDFGVPQNRKRVFIFAVRKDLKKLSFEFPPKSTHFSPSEYRYPKWRSASSVFEAVPKKHYQQYWKDYFGPKLSMTRKDTFKLLADLESGDGVDKNDSCNIHMLPTDNMRKRFEDTPFNGSRIDAGLEHQLNCHAGDYKGHKDVYGRILIHQPSNTITTGCNNPSKGRFVHPWKDHGITLRHCARLQSFPDYFKFTGSTTEQAKQIGNAVPPLLGKLLISSIINGLIQEMTVE